MTVDTKYENRLDQMVNELMAAAEGGEEWPAYAAEDSKTGKHRWFPDNAVIVMLAAEIIYISEGSKGLGFIVNCNDTFAYACADCEEVPAPNAYYRADSSPGSFWRLYDLAREHGPNGATWWAVEKRRERPIPPVVKSLQAAGLWDESIFEKEDK